MKVFLSGILAITAMTVTLLVWQEAPSDEWQGLLKDRFRAYDLVAASYLTLQQERGTEVALDQLVLDWQENSDLAAYCHGIMHQLGHKAYLASGNSLAEAILKGRTECDGGYIHGIIEAAAASYDYDWRGLVAECEEHEDLSILKGACYHGLGHGALFAARFNTKRAVRSCENLENRHYINACVKGVLMQHFIGVLESDMESHFAYCSQFEHGSARKFCFYYARLPFFDSGGNVEDALSLCNQHLSAEDNVACIEGVIAYASALNVRSPRRVISLCENEHVEYGDCEGVLIKQLYKYAAGEIEPEVICDEIHPNSGANKDNCLEELKYIALLHRPE